MTAVLDLTDVAVVDLLQISPEDLVRDDRRLTLSDNQEDSGNLHCVAELAGRLRGKRQHEVSVQPGGDAGEGVDSVSCSAALLEARDHRLGRAHALCQLALAQARLHPEIVDELAQCKILLDGGTSRRGRLTAACLDILPTRSVSHSSTPSRIATHAIIALLR